MELKKVRKRIAVLSHCNVHSDYRVIKTINSLSKEFDIDIFYHGSKEDAENCNFQPEKVNCFGIKHRKGIKQFMLKHTLFCFEYKYLSKEVLERKKKYDIVWANDLPTLYPASLIAKKLNAKLIYDSHEIYNETLNQFFIPSYKNGAKNLIFKFMIYTMRKHGVNQEKKLIKSTDLMFTVNHSIKKYFESKYGYNRVKVMMNLPISINHSQIVPFDFCDYFKWSRNSTIVLYQGALNSGRGLKLLINSFEHLENTYKLVIIGDGILKKTLKEMVINQKLNFSIGFIDAVPLSELPKYTKGSDIGINLLESFNLSKQLASPNKLFEYVHSCIPVVATNTIENKDVFSKFQIGLLCENNPVDIARKIQEVKTQIKKFKNELIEARKFYKWERQEQNIIDCINHLFN
jgi:glycosyltransferase involved in cell wall biosynthesis